MKTIFIGTTEFGIPALDVLHRDFGLQLIITQPDKPAGRKKILTSPPVKIWALAKGVDFIQPEKIADAVEAIKNVGADAMIVAAYGQIIPKNILELPKRHSINIHSSLLPKYRGASPIQAAILNDDKETGVTLMLMDEKMDHGPILSQRAIPIEESDDYSSLHQKLADLGAQMLAETLPQWLAEKTQPQEQNHDQATFVKMIRRDDARIDWTQSARRILQQIKAFNPEPGTWTTLDKKSVKIMEAEEVPDTRIDLPGKILGENHDCLVKCGTHSLKLIEVQPEGKNPISGRDFLNGLKNSETKVFI